MTTTTANRSSAAAPSTTEETCTINSHPDMVVFGSMAFKIANDLSERIDAALVQGVSSLPGDDTSLLLQKLRRLYFRNVDVMESYLVRNIFTLDNVTRKNKVVQAFLAGGVDGGIAKENDATQTVNTNVDIPDFDYPNKKDIPSSEELNKMQQELTEKRNQLRAARRKRNELLAKLEILTSAHQAVQGVSASLQETIPDHEAIQQVVLSKDRLEILQTNASELTKKLEEEKRDRHDDEEDEVDFQAKKQKMTLEQHYKEQRSITKTQGSLTQVKKMLQK